MLSKYTVKATRRPCNGALRYNRPHPPTEPRTLCVTWTARHGPHVTQVQAALRCAEGTYSCCRVLLSVFQIRSLPSCAQRARNCCDLGLKAQGNAARPPSAAILPVRVRPSASRETRVRENSKAHMRSCTGATETLIGPPGFCGRAIVFNQPQTDAEVSYSNFVIVEVEIENYLWVIIKCNFHLLSITEINALYYIEPKLNIFHFKLYLYVFTNCNRKYKNYITVTEKIDI